ncbi:MAG: hypothetical protein EA423_05005 [Phycisphaerales bacterium]|nr:MAG: hypothetical protein EA423_05005 [Phycisphaerales bacterium]
MPQCVIDNSLTRLEVPGFRYPLGVFPTSELTPRPGFAVSFEPADGGESAEDGAEWEEWPDRYAYEVVVSSERLPAMVSSLLPLLPGRVYPILDVLGRDAYREIDPFISYELVGLDRFIDGVRRYRPFLYEDGLCGFGAMCDDPFIYLVIDEHKNLVLRVTPEDRERVEKILRSFDLEQIEDPVGIDAADHEHRSVLLAPEDKPEFLSVDEVVERLRDEWRLTLNIDIESNTDDDGRELGVTAWRCLVRVNTEENPDPKYAEVLMEAPNFRCAEEGCQEATIRRLGLDEASLIDLITISADRVRPETLKRWLAGRRQEASEMLSDLPDTRIHRVRWLG